MENVEIKRSAFTQPMRNFVHGFNYNEHENPGTTSILEINWYLTVMSVCTTLAMDVELLGAE